MLTKASNRRYNTKIATAWHTLKPPTLYMGARGRYARVNIEWDDDIGDWYEVPMDQNQRTELDVRLEAGWQFYLEAKCPKCGVPFWYGRTTDPRVQFKIEESECYSCTAVDTEQAARNKSKQDMKGITLIAVPTGVSYEDGTSDPLPVPYETMGAVG